MISPGIQMLEVAIGIKDSLMAAGFTSIDSLLRSNPTDIAAVLGIEIYVAKLIIDAAKRASGRESKVDAAESNNNATAVAAMD
ncbi:hypothetical protein Ngar_c26500 [Candidatus Nitrososphaera gargensis Ga9.2]|uniref:Uncharacterized protein n=1 Tax=Nitrososphaera gargensis (strain Ga9.2) TaxID=1237085 RepID=K0ILM9_NITGG|nr:hypothetical protein [Candidatus Nitrososphaera gargensis]AFU59572.1 hypothetical protein Ngar_c26500 [Candidatus Nitrososphaera gargensis Ga9.2]